MYMSNLVLILMSNYAVYLSAQPKIQILSYIRRNYDEIGDCSCTR